MSACYICAKPGATRVKKVPVCKACAWQHGIALIVETPIRVPALTDLRYPLADHPALGAAYTFNLDSLPYGAP